MLFYLRILSPITMDELSATVAIEALEWHYGHLTDQSRAARDRADRPAWARAQMHRSATGTLVTTLRNELHELGPMPEEAAEYHRATIQRRGLKMPQSAANAHVLRAERAARIEAERARKAAYWERVETGRRMAGGKWSRPRIIEGEALPQDTGSNLPTSENNPEAG